MKFQKGNKHGKGGRQTPPGGRPTKRQVEAREMSKKLLKEKLGIEASKAVVKLKNSLMSGKPEVSLRAAELILKGTGLLMEKGK